MKSLIKILKILFVLVLVVGVVGSIYFGVLGITPAAGAATEVPFEALGKLPFTSINNAHNNTYGSANLESNTYTISAGDKTIDYSPEFSLYDFLHGEEMAWRREAAGSTSKEPKDELDPINAITENAWDDTNGYLLTDESNRIDRIYDAISLIKLASYNERTVPYFRTYTDAGGMAVIANGSIKGGLMVQAQEIYNNLGENQIYWKEQINALANVEASDALKQLAAAIPSLNRATREGRYNNILWEHNGAGPIYKPGKDPGNAIPALDDGICYANWDATAGDKSSSSIVYSTLDQSADANWRKVIESDGKLGRNKVWQEMYSLKYILDLTRKEVYDDGWFNDASIERVYVDENGVDTTEVTDNWYLKVSLKADLPDIDEIEPGFNDLDKAKQREIINKNYMGKPLNKDGWQGSDNPTFEDCTEAGNWAGNSNMFKLLGYTGASPVCFTKLEYEVEIWNNGLLKKWNTVEGWYGELVTLQANVKPYSPVVYSYDYSVCTEEIIKDYLVRLTNAKID